MVQIVKKNIKFIFKEVQNYFQISNLTSFGSTCYIFWEDKFKTYSKEF